MSRDYDLDKQAAIDASRGTKFISASGAYLTTIKVAWGANSGRGAEFVGFVFYEDSGLKLTTEIYTFGKTGEKLNGFGIVQAIMTCTRTRAIKPVRGDVTRWDFQARADLVFKEDVYPELADKRVGLLVQMEEYESNGQVKTKPVVIGAFDPTTRMVAHEILTQAQVAKTLDSQLKWLEANPVRKLKPKPAVQGTPAIAGTPAAAGFDDDIPSDEVPPCAAF